MEVKDILLLVLPIITGLIGSYLTYFFGIRSKKDESMLKFKEEKYANLLILLQGFMGKTVSADTKRKFFEEQYKSWLYSSDQVVLAINQMVDLVIKTQLDKPNFEEHREAVGKIVLAMRKDMLGKRKTHLSPNNFIYTNVID